jgi:hypothetical protein
MEKAFENFLRATADSVLSLTDDSPETQFREFSNREGMIHIFNYRSVFFPHIICHVYEKSPYKKLLFFSRYIQSTITYFNKGGWFIDKQRSDINRRILLKLSR